MQVTRNSDDAIQAQRTIGAITTQSLMILIRFCTQFVPLLKNVFCLIVVKYKEDC